MSRPSPATARDPIGTQLATATAWIWVICTLVTFWLRSQALHTASFFALAALNPVTSVGLIPVFGWAIYRKLGVMLTATIFLGFVQVVVNSPLDSVTGCGSRTADDEIVIVASNVYYKGASANQVANMLVESDADIIVLLEVVPLFLSELLAIEDVTSRWPHKASRTDSDPSGILVLSRFPLQSQNIIGTYSIETVVETPHGLLAFNGIHTTAPFTPANIVVWYRQFGALNVYANTQKLPTVMAGDFNATEDHAAFRNLLAVTTDADSVASCGWSATWPTDLPGPAFMQLDHVLATDSIEILDLDTLTLDESDHLAVRASIRISNDG